MNRYIYILLFLVIGFFGISFNSYKTDCTIDKVEALAAYKYLNEFRSAPIECGKKIKLRLKNIAVRPVLKWDSVLCKVAEQKALDMAKRNYFSHTTPEGKGINILLFEAGYPMPAYYYKIKSDNYFESINAGAESGIAAINDLIRDSGVPSLGHRKHLLGIDDTNDAFNSKLTDIGIGFARSEKKKSVYTTYVCVIISSKNLDN